LALIVPTLNRDKNVCADVRGTAVTGESYVNLHFTVFVYLILKKNSAIPGIMI
jgi:hypothetical protein